MEITPAEVSLNPREEVDIQVEITPPPGFVDRQLFNVNARYGDAYAGGVSLIVVPA